MRAVPCGFLPTFDRATGRRYIGRCMPILLKDFTADQLHDALSHVGVTRRRRGRFMRRPCARRATTARSGISATLLDEVRWPTAFPT